MYRCVKPAIYSLAEKIFFGLTAFARSSYLKPSVAARAVASVNCPVAAAGYARNESTESVVVPIRSGGRVTTASAARSARIRCQTR
jgi:hypothetical protein